MDNQFKKKLALFGAGQFGKMTVMELMRQGKRIDYIVDNDINKWGHEILGVPIISMEDFCRIKDEYHLIVAINSFVMSQIKKQLEDMAVTDYEIFDLRKVTEGERIISYSDSGEMEDVILYHVLKEEEDIFYIDVGSADPFSHSVTKLLYDMKSAHGINIEPRRGVYQRTVSERPRDINLCLGIGREEGELELFYQEGGSTFMKENVIKDEIYSERVKVTTLKSICDKYVPKGQDIHFLKIDVEGAEKDVLLGSDFEQYRPWIIVIESTIPGTDIDCYDKWENILLSQQYHFVFRGGVNRYYVSDEKAEIDVKFCPMNELKQIYRIYHAAL